MYHTQEKRGSVLVQPIICQRNDAWLGTAYYYWADEIDAIHWGNNSKKNTGYFQIYISNIDCENVLDTVFNEEHYNFWVKQIEKAAKSISKKTGIKASLKEINLYFKERVSWPEVDGILFQDLPTSDDLLVRNLNYRKRIQIAVFNLKVIHTFALHLEMECN